MHTKLVSFFIFFQELSNGKKIKAPGPKMTKIASRGSCLKGEVWRNMNSTYVLGFVVLRDVVKVFPVSSPSFARTMTGRNRARSHSGA